MRLPPDNSGMPDIPHIRRHTPPDYLASQSSHADHLEAIHTRIDLERIIDSAPDGKHHLAWRWWADGESAQEIATRLKTDLQTARKLIQAFEVFREDCQ